MKQKLSLETQALKVNDEQVREDVMKIVECSTYC